jgi:hypothetical protein
MIGWNAPLPGKLKEAFGLFQEGLGYFEGLQKEGWFERYEAIGLTPHGGDLNGAFLLYGTRAKLDELRRRDDFEAMVFKLASVMSNVGVVPGLTGDGLRQAMTRISKVV